MQIGQNTSAMVVAPLAKVLDLLSGVVHPANLVQAARHVASGSSTVAACSTNVATVLDDVHCVAGSVCWQRLANESE